MRLCVWPNVQEGLLPLMKRSAEEHQKHKEEQQKLEEEKKAKQVCWASNDPSPVALTFGFVLLRCQLGFTEGWTHENEAASTGSLDARGAFYARKGREEVSGEW